MAQTRSNLPKQSVRPDSTVGRRTRNTTIVVRAISRRRIAPKRVSSLKTIPILRRTLQSRLRRQLLIIQLLLLPRTRMRPHLSLRNPKTRTTSQMLSMARLTPMAPSNRMAKRRASAVVGFKVRDVIALVLRRTTLSTTMARKATQTATKLSRGRRRLRMALPLAPQTLQFLLPPPMKPRHSPTSPIATEAIWYGGDDRYTVGDSLP
jgi:hypothetical protein